MTSRAGLWAAAHGLSLVAATGVLVVANRNQWFFGDEWAFITDRGPDFAHLDLFRPHNDHWSTIPLVIYWRLLGTFGLRSYLPYAGVVILLHLGLAHLLWRASLRAGASAAIATALAGIFAVLGAGSENLLWAFQMGFVGAVAFGWLAVLLHDHDGRFGWRDGGGWLASVTALMFSGPALALVAVATLTVGLRRRRWVDTLATAAVPLAVFAVWYGLEGRHAERVSGEDGTAWEVVDWAWAGLTHAATTVVGIPESGALLILALLLWWARHLELATTRAALAFAGTIGAVAFFLVTGLGRVSLGPESAEASRYAYIATALLLPAAAIVLSRMVPDGAAPTALVLAFCALVAFHNVGLLRTGASEEMGREQPLKGVVVAAATRLRARDPLAWNPPSPRQNPNLSAQDLVRLDGYGWLPDTRPTRAEELTAEALTDVALVLPSGPLGAVALGGTGVDLRPAPPSVRQAAGVGGSGSCVEALPVIRGAQVVLGADAGVWRVRLQGPAGRRIKVYLQRDGLASRAMTFELPSTPLDLVSRAEGATIAVTLPPSGSTTLCGIGTPPVA